MQPKKEAPVVLEKNGGMVRLRGLKWSLPVTLDIEGRGRIHVDIQPNRWTKVPDEVYAVLKQKFDAPRYTAIPDVEANEDHPHAPGQAPIMTTEEVDPQFYVEFKS
jgi:hypothetical protein